MFSHVFKTPCPDNYCLEMTCHIHGWKNLSPFEWNPEDNSLSFACWAGDWPVDVKTIQSGKTIKAFIKSHNSLDDKNKEELSCLIRRSLGLDTDTKNLLKKAKQLGAEYERLVLSGAGRMLRTPTLWEDAAKTLFTTNCSWSLTKKMCQAACSDKFCKPTPKGRYPFPMPEIFVQFESFDLKKLMPIGYRSEYFINLAKHFSQDPSLKGIEINGYDYQTAYQLVSSLRGFGPYASTHLMLICGYFDRIPVDTVVISYLKSNYRFRKPEAFIDRHYKKWKEYKWWGLKLEKILKRENWLGD